MHRDMAFSCQAVEAGKRLPHYPTRRYQARQDCAGRCKGSVSANRVEKKIGSTNGQPGNASFFPIRLTKKVKKIVGQSCRLKVSEVVNWAKFPRESAG